MNFAACARSSDYCLLAVSCPIDVYDQMKWLLCLPSRKCSLCIDFLRLLLSGDVETNPGPTKKGGSLEKDSDSNTLASVLETVRRIEAGQQTILSELQGLRDKQSATDDEVKRLTERIVALETSVASQNSPVEGTSSNVLHTLTNQLQTVTSRCDDAENRMRRSNLLFYGIDDDESEDWAASEETIIKLCTDKLEVPSTSNQFERVHRLGRYSPGKKRPIIAKFTFYKDKQKVLASAFKLKGSTVSIGEDFSPPTRLARRKLVEFAKIQKQKFNLSVDRLRMGKETYVYNPDSNTVELSTR